MRLGTALGIVLVATASAAAGPYTFTDDLLNDWTGLSICEIHGIGSYVDTDNGKVHFQIRTDVPQSGFDGSDGRAWTHFSPGDLFIAVGTSNPFDPAAAVHGIALTTHGNIVQQAYPGENWDDVVEGRLYTDAAFATGTYENYQHARAKHGRPFSPDDQDGDNHTNSYWSLIKTGTEVLDVSDIDYTPAAPGDAWDYLITGYVETGAIGLTPGMEYVLFHSIECGNDAAQHIGSTPSFPGGDPPAVPEPGTAGLAFVGLIFALRRRRQA
jgi:MYXO-CTERM domain-containing protein